jgi:hypothetical protein
MMRTLSVHRLALGAAFAGLSLTACTAPATPPSDSAAMSPASAPALAPAPALTVPQLLAQAAQLKGKTITLTGTYAGWTGRCQGGPPVSRSDWMIEDKAAQACVYASGPQPQGIPAPPQATSIGMPVRVTGLVAFTPDGRAYLQIPSRD